MLFKKVDTRRVENCEAILMLLTEQQVIEENDSKMMSVVGKLEPRKTSLEAQHPMSNMTPPTVLVVMRGSRTLLPP